MKAANRKCLTVGGFSVDHIVAADGRVWLHQLGGNAVYSALGIGWTGNVPQLVSRLPQNFPAHWLELLKNQGFDVRYCKRGRESVTHTEWFFYNHDGSRTDQVFLSTDELSRMRCFHGGYLSPQERDRLLHAAAKDSAEGMTFGAFRRRYPLSAAELPSGSFAGVHLAPNPLEVQTEIAQELRGRAQVISVDPPPVALQSPQELLPLLRCVDLFLPSEKEVHALFGQGNLCQIMRWCSEKSGVCVIVKLGARGCLFLEPGRDVKRIPALPDVSEVNPTGAGDIFAGAVLGHYTVHRSVERAVCFGAAAAGIRVQYSDIPSLLNLDPDEVHKAAAKLYSEVT